MTEDQDGSGQEQQRRIANEMRQGYALSVLRWAFVLAGREAR